MDATLRRSGGLPLTQWLAASLEVEECTKGKCGRVHDEPRSRPAAWELILAGLVCCALMVGSLGLGPD